MTYRDPPNNEELSQMLTEANKEKEASTKRIKELQEQIDETKKLEKDRLTRSQLENFTSQVQHRKATHIDVSGLSPHELDILLVAHANLKKRMVTQVDPSGLALLGSVYPAEPEKEPKKGPGNRLMPATDAWGEFDIGGAVVHGLVFGGLAVCTIAVIIIAFF